MQTLQVNSIRPTTRSIFEVNSEKPKGRRRNVQCGYLLHKWMKLWQQQCNLKRRNNTLWKLHVKKRINTTKRTTKSIGINSHVFHTFLGISMETFWFIIGVVWLSNILAISSYSNKTIWWCVSVYNVLHLCFFWKTVVSSHYIYS